MLIYRSDDHYKMECSRRELETLLDMLALRSEIEARIMQKEIRDARDSLSDHFHVMDMAHDQIDLIQSTTTLISQHCSSEQISRYECIFDALHALHAE